MQTNKKKIGISPIDVLFDVLGITTFLIYLVFPFEWHKIFSDIQIRMIFQFEWYFNLSDVPILVTFQI